MTSNLFQRNASQPLAVLFLGTALSLSAAACGGGLSHTVDDTNLSAEQKKQLSGQESAVEAADDNIDKRAEEQAQAGNRVESAKALVAKKEKELAIAKAKLELEEAKAGAAEARKVEAEKASMVQQAKLELEKLKTVGPGEGQSQADYKEKLAEFEKQVADRQIELADAKKDAANKERSIEEAQQDLAEVQGAQ